MNTTVPRAQIGLNAFNFLSPTISEDLSFYLRNGISRPSPVGSTRTAGRCGGGPNGPSAGGKPSCWSRGNSVTPGSPTLKGAERFTFQGASYLGHSKLDFVMFVSRWRRPVLRTRATFCRPDLSRTERDSRPIFQFPDVDRFPADFPNSPISMDSRPILQVF
jgi:hypothetical protein